MEEVEVKWNGKVEKWIDGKMDKAKGESWIYGKVDLRIDFLHDKIASSLKSPSYIAAGRRNDVPGYNFVLGTSTPLSDPYISLFRILMI